MLNSFRVTGRGHFPPHPPHLTDLGTPEKPGSCKIKKKVDIRVKKRFKRSAGDGGGIKGVKGGQRVVKQKHTSELRSTLSKRYIPRQEGTPLWRCFRSWQPDEVASFLGYPRDQVMSLPGHKTLTIQQHLEVLRSRHHGRLCFDLMSAVQEHQNLGSVPRIGSLI